ncbi:hypothetical protein DNK47_03200 [Mycoplasma wenyonii]|uniref:Type I restriction modification DNA specificity domain-containing protein n=1 Tax=Mycoplasma wenyonii TaxID=65123 RepID=A0A328PJX4_9MOLU|nr:restriction endonuclease subunit S [Mycoplasma wenyonii]RAO94784.1 hypothetical protein DNK47_03200 [Mycoplasma wenyonii]
MGRKVKLVKLGEICEFQVGLLVPSNMQSKDNLQEELLPFLKIGNLQEANITTDKLSWINPKDFSIKDSHFLYPDEIIVAKSGANSGKIAINQTNQKIIFYSGCAKLCLKARGVDKKYLFHALLTKQEEIYTNRTTGAQPNLVPTKFMKLKIPLPPLKQQEKIAKWLETFSSLERQLERQLERHKTQYRYYLNRLMRGGRLTELKEIIKEAFSGTLITKSQITTEGIPCIRYGEIYTTYNICCEAPISHIALDNEKEYRYCEKNDLLITKIGESISEIAKPLAYIGEKLVAIDSNTTLLKHNQNAKYLAYALSTDNIKKQKQHVCNISPITISVNLKQISKLKIPLPSLEKQEKIANWLDRFRELTENISKGLPREILLLKQQSRYYREKLIN